VKVLEMEMRHAVAVGLTGHITVVEAKEH